MTAPLTPAEIASMVDDADLASDLDSLSVTQSTLRKAAGHVRALAAECAILTALNEHATSERERQAAEIERLALAGCSVVKRLKDVTNDRDKLAKWSVEAIDKIKVLEAELARANELLRISTSTKTISLSEGVKHMDAVAEHLATQERKNG